MPCGRIDILWPKRNSQEQMMIGHKHIAGTAFEIRGRDAAWKRTLVVMKNLMLDPTTIRHQ